MITKFEEGKRYRVNAPDLKQHNRVFTFHSGESPYDPRRINSEGVYHFWDAPILFEWCMVDEDKRAKELDDLIRKHEEAKDGLE